MSLNWNLGSPFPTRSFLSSAIAEALPSINTHNLGRILGIFGIRYGTPMAEMIETTVPLCGDSALPGEERTCASSLEEIMAFATTHLGKNVQTLATTGAPTESAPAPTSTAPVKVMGYPKHSIEDGKQVVVCHELIFPSAMYVLQFPIMQFQATTRFKLPQCPHTSGRSESPQNRRVVLITSAMGVPYRIPNISRILPRL